MTAWDSLTNAWDDSTLLWRELIEESIALGLVGNVVPSAQHTMNETVAFDATLETDVVGGFFFAESIILGLEGDLTARPPWDNPSSIAQAWQELGNLEDEWSESGQASGSWTEEDEL